MARDAKSERNSFDYERLWRIINSVNAILCELDPQGKILWINKYGLEFFGYGEDELLGKDVYETLVPKIDSTGRDLSGLIREVLENGSERVPNINENVRKDGSRVWVYWSNKVFRDKSGKPYLILSSGIDITETVRLRNRLEQEHRRNSSLIRILNLLMSPSASIEDLSEAILQEAKILTSSSHGIVATLDGRTGQLVRHTIRDIVDCKVNTKSSLFPGVEENYPTLLGHAINTKNAFYTNSPENHTSYLGVPEGHLPIERFLATPVLDTSEDRRVLGFIALINSRRDYNDEDLDNVRFLAHYLGLALGRKALEESVLVTERFYRALFENNPVPMFQVNKEGVITKVNNRFEEVFGYSKEEVEGKMSWKAITHALELERLSTFWKKRLSGRPAPKSYETRAVTKGGKELEVSVHIFEMDAFFSVAVVDLTELRTLIKRLERMNVDLKRHSEDLEKLVEEKSRELIEKERLATIGETALMIGHDLRNPLQAILNSTFILDYSLNDLPKEKRAEFTRLIESVRRNISYMNKIVSDLQDFSRSFRIEKSLVDLGVTVELAVKGVFVPENIEVNIDVENKKLLLDPQLISRALRNLVSNSVQAMPLGGRISVRAWVEPIKAPPNTGGEKLAPEVNNNHKVVQDSETGPFERVVVFYSVADTGGGIPPEVLNNLFKPFTTTKAKGTGLGLTIVKRIVDVLGGTISVRSDTGSGTTFTLSFPSEHPRSSTLFG